MECLKMLATSANGLRAIVQHSTPISNGQRAVRDRRSDETAMGFAGHRLRLASDRYNGLDDSLLDDWSATRAFAHSGGINDATHPDEGALQKLEHRKDHLHYARTDRNGLIKVSFTASGARMTPSRGDLDDFTSNSDVFAQPPEELREPVEINVVLAGLPQGRVALVALAGQMLSSECRLPRPSSGGTGQAARRRTNPARQKVASARI
jgi:hypothetical protein